LPLGLLTSLHYENLFCAIKRFELISAPERVEVVKADTNATLLSRSNRIFLCQRSRKQLRRLCREFARPVAFTDAFMAIGVAYRPRNPEENPLYGVVAGHLETFLAKQRERDRYVPGFVESEFRELG
jgi:hypothetical protein